MRQSANLRNNINIESNDMLTNKDSATEVVAVMVKDGKSIPCH